MTFSNDPLAIADPDNLRFFAKAYETDVKEHAGKITIGHPARVLRAAADRIELLEGLLESSVKAAVDQPARLCIEIAPHGPPNVLSALMAIAEKHEIAFDDLMQKDLKDVKALVIKRLADKWEK